MNLSKLFSESKTFDWGRFITISILMIAYKLGFHELWKDEWQAWLVARDNSWWNMLSFLHYEGHPALWYTYLKIWTYLPIADATSLQLAHAVLWISFMYLFWIKLSLPSIWKFLFTLSYFMVYEYGVINRGYVLVMLLSGLFVFLSDKKRIGLSALALLLLCQTEVYGVIIAFAQLAYSYLNKRHWNTKYLLSFIAGVILFVVTVFPRGNEDDFTRAYNQQQFSLEVIGESFQGHLANVFGIGLISDTAANGSSAIGIILSLLLLAGLIFIFRNNKNVLIAGGIGLFGFIAFGILIFTGGVRQWGMVFILFWLMLLLAHRDTGQWNKVQSVLITLLLICPFIHGIRALSTDIQMPFSNAEAAGAFIKEKVPQEVPVVVINKFETAPVGAYADRPLYELPSGEEFTYFKWLEKVYIPTQSELLLFAQYRNVGGLVVLSPEPLDANRFPKAQLWETFDQANFKRENYWLYSLARD